MTCPKAAIFGENIVYRRATGKDYDDLIRVGHTDVNETNLSFVNRITSWAVGIPRKTGFAAYHVQEKCAIGFLSLVRHAMWLYSIRNLFTNSNFRKRGVATGLIDYASTMARKSGARKEFLDVPIDNFDAMKFYSKLGFKKTSDTSIVNIVGSTAGCARKFSFGSKNQLISLNASSRKEAMPLFGVYQRCMGREWTDYFETYSDNLINGFAQDHRRFFSREALTNESSDFYVLVYSRPPFSYAYLEAYNTSSSTILPLLGDLFGRLQRKRIAWINMRLFNMNGDDYRRSNLRNDAEFNQWQTLVMGRPI